MFLYRSSGFAECCGVYLLPAWKFLSSKKYHCRRANPVAKRLSMPDPIQPPDPIAQKQFWNPDVVFAILADPARRRLLCMIASSKPLPATGLQGSSRKRLDATLKHLIALRKAGMVTTAPDPVDGQRTLYGLSSNVPVIQSADGRVLDFGCCVVRL